MASYCIHRAILSVTFEEVLSVVAIIADKGVTEGAVRLYSSQCVPVTQAGLPL